MGTQVRLPPSLLFPIEIVDTLVSEGEAIKKRQPLLKFKYWNRVPEGVPANDDTEPQMVTREFYGTFESPFNGQLQAYNVKSGDRIADNLTVVLQILESCDHSVQYGGLCALCGQSLDTKDYMGYSDIDRAPIAMSHDSSGLTVSRTEAERIENSSTQRLLKAKKLTLVVDLDQTVIHAAIDPEIGNWIADPGSRYHEVCKEVKSFVLRENIGSIAPGKKSPLGRQPHESSVTCTYYVKPRPGLHEFLETMNEIYEMHVYTMATKSYATEIAHLIDPDRKYFGDRILTRDESGNLLQKDLNRLFPVTQALVTIIDDRGDVWRWSPHLIRVAPYHFFSGTGDINSSYLPKRDGLVTPEGEENAKSEEEGANEHDDHELQNISRALTRLHQEYFSRYDEANPTKIPDVGKILPAMKEPVFGGCIFLFSGIFPLGTNLDSADIVQWVRSFGAVVLADFLPSVTHVIAKYGGTAKVRQAAGVGKLVVSVPWIFACLENWKRMPEEPYLIDVPDPIYNSAQSGDNFAPGEEPKKDIADGFVRSISRGEVDWDTDDEELRELLGSDYDDDENENAIEDEEEIDIKDSKESENTRDLNDTNDANLLSPTDPDGSKDRADADVNEIENENENENKNKNKNKNKNPQTDSTNVSRESQQQYKSAGTKRRSSEHSKSADNLQIETANGSKDHGSANDINQGESSRKRARDLPSSDNSDDESFLAELEESLV